MSASLQTYLPKVARSLVELSIYSGNLCVQCTICGQGWQVNNPGADHRLARGWWKCPYGCTQRALDEQQEQTDK